VISRAPRSVCEREAVRASGGHVHRAKQGWVWQKTC
jgi:hypothetical protein